MEDALIITTAIAVILFVGLICSWVSSRLRVPEALLLILMGVFFGTTKFKGAPLVVLPDIFLSSLGILALAMIVFDSTARLRLRELDTFSMQALKLTMIWGFFNLTLFTAASYYILGISFWPSIILASLMTSTSPDILLVIKEKTPTFTLLKLESIFNTPLTVILPFVMVDLMQSVRTNIVSDIIEQLIPFIMKFIVGLGAGVFVGLVLFKVIQRSYAEVYSPLAVIIAALFSYVLAENLGGSGVLAVTALGLFFGNVYVKEKPTLLSIETVLTKALYILLFVSIGIIIKLPMTKEFFFTTGALFAIYVLIRFMSVSISTRKDNLTAGDLLVMTLNIPKGIATVAVVFILAVLPIDGIGIVLDATFAFILYTIILSAIVTWAATFIPHEKHPHRH